MSKEEGLCTVERLHIPVVLVRMSTSSNSVETFQHWQKPKNEAIHNNAGLLLVRLPFHPPFEVQLQAIGIH